MALKLFACGDVVNFTSKPAFVDKNLFNRIHANVIVKLWRKIKWRS